MVNHLTKGFLIRGIIFILIVIIVAGCMLFGVIPDSIYWPFIISVNIIYHIMEYIIRLRQERTQYKIAYYELVEISTEMVDAAKEVTHDIEVMMSPKTLQFLDKFSDRFRDARDLT